MKDKLPPLPPTYNQVVDALAECANYLSHDDNGIVGFWYSDSSGYGVEKVPDSSTKRILDILDRAQNSIK